MNDQQRDQRDQALTDAKNLLEILRVMEDQDHLALNREGQRNAIEILAALLDELDRQEQHNTADSDPNPPQRTELGSDREHARDQLEAATVRTYRQMRTDQERIAELERELAEVQAQLWDYWKTYHDEHCTEDWPHTRDRSCYYAPPPAARKTS